VKGIAGGRDGSPNCWLIDYGVVLTPDGRKLDPDATRAARAVDSSA
jgi:hypothetical protein